MEFSGLSHQSQSFILLLNVYCWHSFMSSINFMLIRVEHDNSFITSRPGRKSRFSGDKAQT